MPVHRRTETSIELAALFPRQRQHSLPFDTLPTTLSTEDDDFLLLRFRDSIDLMPSATFSNEKQVWLEHIMSLSERYQYLRYAILSFSATYMFFITRQIRYSQLAILYRGIVLRDLQGAINLQDKDVLDAGIAASILLADQAAMEGDWRACVMHTRGLNTVCHYNDLTLSAFCATRSKVPSHGRAHDRRFDTEAMQSSKQGNHCYDSLLILQRYYSEKAELGMDKLLTKSFLGSDLELSSGSLQHTISFAHGGIGHLVVLASTVHTIFAMISSDNERLQKTELYKQQISEFEKDGLDWLEEASHNLINRAFEDEPAALLLLAYKMAFDVLAHRCRLLLNPMLLPAPATIKAMRFIASTNVLINNLNQIPGEGEGIWIFKTCMIWPMWTLNCSAPLDDKQDIQNILAAYERAGGRHE